MKKKQTKWLDAVIAGRQPEHFQPYEDSLTAKVQGKLLQYYDIMQEGRNQSLKDKEILQGLVSDISHQVKTPLANMKLYAGILQKPNLTEDKRQMFLTTLWNVIRRSRYSTIRNGRQRPLEIFWITL